MRPFRPADDGAMAEKPEDSQPLEMPPSENWTPTQALAAAMRVAWVEVIAVGSGGDGEPVFRHSRMTQKDMLWLAGQLRDYAMTM